MISAEQTITASALGLLKAGQYWAENPDFPGYLIGAHGEVASFLKRTPRILSPIRIGQYDGYTMRRHDGRLVKRYRHRLVAEMMYGPGYQSECRHKDGDRKNADFTNLAWGTAAENAHDKLAHGTHNRGARHYGAKLTALSVEAMREERASRGTPYSELARKHGVTTMTAYRAATGKSWK